MVAIVAVLSAVSASLLLGLTDEREPAPETALSFEEQPEGSVPTAYVYHESGEVIDGDRVEIRGVADPGASPRAGDAGRRDRPGRPVRR